MFFDIQMNIVWVMSGALILKKTLKAQFKKYLIKELQELWQPFEGFKLFWKAFCKLQIALHFSYKFFSTL